MTVNSACHATAAVQAQPAAATEKAAPSKTDAASAPADSVKISEEAKAAVVAAQTASQAAAQEATETPEQTAREARHGDHQAQRLIARHAAAAYAASR